MKKFKRLNAAEFDKLDDAAKEQYIEDKAAHDKETRKGEIDEAMKDLMTLEVGKKAIADEIKTAIEGIKTALNTDGISKEQIKEMRDAIAFLKENNGSGGGGRASAHKFDQLLEKALKEALPQLKEMRAGQWAKNKEINITVKAAINVLSDAAANAAGVTTPDSIVTNGISDYAVDVRPDAYIINFLDNGNTDKPSLPYMDKLPNEGTMEITAEGALKPLISVKFELRYSTTQKVAGRVKLSEEAMDDLPFIMSVIKGELKYEHDIAEQKAIFVKINAIAGAFVAGSLAGTTDAPTNYDAIRAAVYSQKIASYGKFIPNVALVPSADIYAMGATKDKNNQYVIPPFVLPDGTKVAGVTIVEVNDDSVADGSFIVGDFKKLHRKIYKSFTIRIGQGINVDEDDNVQSDFESNMYTVIGESRQHLYIYENEKAAFTKSTFAAVKTAIEAVAVI